MSCEGWLYDVMLPFSSSFVVSFFFFFSPPGLKCLVFIQVTSLSSGIPWQTFGWPSVLNGAHGTSCVKEATFNMQPMVAWQMYSLCQKYMGCSLCLRHLRILAVWCSFSGTPNTPELWIVSTKGLFTFQEIETFSIRQELL